ncbi:alpha/beta fold hydrolase [Granulosicoccus antarcticus]|uniref:Acetyl-coenzyme A synthetase n=1 Tax=Granulosicoccus antarcticus IMCC3135 TaxID=1192854 RepID=A0A2Z2NY78_9GAMM|nr:alpha/beta fold hydrolase [Granulosicoccus antarcticus]ASJ74901.1 Acetyl-coenzyme A synthetase [Granulosicoccus antarcticus IMCC3135]
MSNRPTAPASLPPAGIVGLEPEWSRLVHTPKIDAVGRTWHILDSWADRSDDATPALTLLCVHGNPSWSFLWRRLLAQVMEAHGDRIRLIAVDQLDMGFSERTGVKRPLAQRIDDLCQLTDTLRIKGPVVTVAHDWGGPISLGWALQHLPKANPDVSESSDSVQLAGVVLTNTAVHQPQGSPAPAVIRLIRSPLVLRNATVNTRAFIQGAIEMSRPALDARVRAGFHAPYLKRSQRSAIADFVADIPLDAKHESASTLDAIATGLTELAQIPALLLWGPRDKVFSDLYLHDLEQRLPHADVHRFPGAAHFVSEDADVAGAVIAWIDQYQLAVNDPAKASTHTAVSPDVPAQPDRRALSDFSVATATNDAIVEIAPVHRSISFGELTERVDHLAAGMNSFGINAGDRVAVMVTPGIDLCLAVYGCWRLGATLVLVDSGLGRTGMQRALRSANPAYLIGIDKALIAAKLLRWPGKRIAVGKRSSVMNKALSIASDMATLTERGRDQATPPWPAPETLAALAFTSGSTGPSKGVIYRHHQIQAQRDALMSLYQITQNDRLVAAFAPFALYGPTMGITSIVPDMDVTSPGTLNAQALADAVKLVNATLVFASPAALVNVIASKSKLTEPQQAACSDVRLVLSAGAPVRAKLLTQATSIFTCADVHTPYGMTEALPIADIALSELQQIGKEAASDNLHAGGVCVGHPLPGVLVHIDPLDPQGEPMGQLSGEPGKLGEIMVQAAHTRDSYDRLWLTNYRASQPAGWHRTGDVGQLDATGRLWVGGRLGHIITTPKGVLAPVASEQRIESLYDITAAAVVGVGPVGTQVVVAVVELLLTLTPRGGASMELTEKVRKVVGEEVDIAAVLVVKKLPVDRRHNSKVDRTAVALWASRTLSGDSVASL